MTDRHDPRDADLDDALRSALRAEADGVDAGPDLLARIHAARAPRRARRAPLLAAAAVVVVAAVAGALAATRPDDDAQRVRVTDGSTTTITVPETGPMPSLVAMVREDGWLVTLDRTTGVVTETVFGGDPDQRDEETGTSSYIDDLDLSPDGRWVYFSTCCEPASGVTYRVEVGRPALLADLDPVAFGALPRLDPGGTRLAVVSGGFQLVVRSADPASDEEPLTLDLDDPYRFAQDLSWSPDGTMLALARGGGAERDITYFEVTPTGIRPSEYGSEVPDRRAAPLWAKNGTSNDDYGPIFDDDPVLVEARSARQDVSYGWTIVVQADGVVTYLPHKGIGRIAPLLLGTGPTRVADW